MGEIFLIRLLTIKVLALNGLRLPQLTRHSTYGEEKNESFPTSINWVRYDWSGVGSIRTSDLFVI